jgi:hypothetical protein
MPYFIWLRYTNQTTTAQVISRKNISNTIKLKKLIKSKKDITVKISIILEKLNLKRKKTVLLNVLKDEFGINTNELFIIKWNMEYIYSHDINSKTYKEARELKKEINNTRISKEIIERLIFLKQAFIKERMTSGIMVNQ